MSLKVMLRTGTAVAFEVAFLGAAVVVVAFVAFDGSLMLYKIFSQSISS